LAGIVPEEAGEAAKMVIMPMAQHKRVEAGGLNPDERQIVVQRLGRKAEINQDLPRFIATMAFDMHRKPKLADQRSARRMIGADAPAKVLDHKTVFLAVGGNRELIVLDEDADGDTVKGRNGSRESVRFNGRCCSEKISEQEAEGSQCSSAGHIASRWVNASKAAGTR
jgi:hypothetical protein